MYRWRVVSLAALIPACGPKTTSKPSSTLSDTAEQDTTVADTAPPADTGTSIETGDVVDTAPPNETADSGDTGPLPPALPDLDTLEAELWSAYVAGAAVHRPARRRRHRNLSQ